MKIKNRLVRDVFKENFAEHSEMTSKHEKYLFRIFIESCNSYIKKIQHLYKFPNGYGASVVRNVHNLGYKDHQYELTTISWKPTNLKNDTKSNFFVSHEWYYKIFGAEDPSKYLTKEEVDKCLDRIKKM